MAAVWMRARAGLQRRALASLALILALGIGGGGALMAFAGARRTDSAVRRFMAYYNPPQGSVDPLDAGDDEPALLARIAQLPQVAASQIGARFLLGTSTNMNAVALGGHSWISRPLIVAGRLANQDRADEAIINDQAENDLHLHLGSTIDAQGMAPGDVPQALRGGPVQPTGEVAHLHVVGIIRLPSDLSLAPAPAGVNFTATTSSSPRRS